MKQKNSFTASLIRFLTCVSTMLLLVAASATAQTSNALKNKASFNAGKASKLADGTAMVKAAVYDPESITCQVSTSCSYGFQYTVTASVSLSCNEATQISTSAEACAGGTGFCKTHNGPSGILTYSSAQSTVQGQNYVGGNCTLEWSYGGDKYSKQLNAQ